MNREDIIRMAREAGYCHAEANDLDSKRLSRFAALVLKAERLAVTEAIKEEMTDELEDEAYHLCMELIAKILKRSQS
jgi:hypothetical protein